ncbi:tetratricopeptide repeat protein [Corallococcus silvisoli]|uniref:tetratricopeptide repeat protein n=1 Tax=Corallococcus silvisoli TaxID=2697031 RepID=UPI0013772BAF|nr:hypothetical protein [Corallococcus silvisoli]NBD14088.1 hypothetical protein [Corallococcus silvisoli]
MRSVLVLFLLVTTPALARSSDDDWKAGLASFREKDFARACPLLRKAAEADRIRGAIWADLGLCELKRGKKTESIHASNLAVRYGDEKVRKSAYFNLGLAGVNLAPQGVTSDGSCAPIEVPKELACGQRIAACGHKLELPGYTYHEEQSAGLVVLSCAEGTCPARLDCAQQGDLPCSNLSIALDSEETLRGMGATPDWTCEDSEVVSTRTLECASKKGANEQTCARKACEEATRWRESPAPRKAWPELEDEIDSWASVNECKSCAEFTTRTRCTVVSIDPCTGRYGAVCTVQETTRDTGLKISGTLAPKTVVQELSFEVAAIPQTDAGM